MTSGPPWRGFLRPVVLDGHDSSSLASRGMLSTLGLAAQGVLRFVTNILVGRLGTPALLGLLQTAISTATFLSLLWPTTAGSAASKFVARARGAGRPSEAEAVARHLRLRTLQSTALLAVSAVPVWAAVSGEGGLWGGLCVAALVIGYSGYHFARGLQFGAGQVARATVWDLIIAVGGIIGVLLALVAGVSGPALLLPLAAAYGVYAAAGWPRHLHGALERPLRREIDGFVALGVAGTMASAGFLQLSMVAARLAGSPDEAGQYAAALTLATPVSLLAGSFSLVLFPAMAEAWGRGDVPSFRRQTDQAMRLLIVVMVPLFGGVALSADLIVRALWGARYGQAADLLPLLLMAVLPTTIGVASVNSLSTRSQRGMAVASGASVCGLVVGLLGWFALAPSFGVAGVAVGYLIGAWVIAAIPVGVVWRRDGHRWGALIIRLAAGVALLSAMLAVRRGLDAPLWTDVLWSSAFVVVWLSFSRREARMARRLLGSVRGPGAS